MRFQEHVSAFTFVSVLAACGEPEPLGAIMLAMQTDVALPDDIAAVGLLVRSEDEATFGRTLYLEVLDTYDTLSGRYVRFPATFAVVEGEEPNRRVRIRLMGFAPSQNGEPQKATVLNEAVTTVPDLRVALLRMPLMFAAQTSVKAGDRNSPEDVVSSCPNQGDVEVAGVCRSPELDSSTLPAYDPKVIFGGGDGSDGSGRCFSVATCFAGASPIVVDTAACTSVAPITPEFALAIERSEAPGDLKLESAEAICSEGKCYVPLDGDSDQGYRIAADGLSISYARSVCRLIESKGLKVVGSGLCQGKTDDTPMCGPWSASRASSVEPLPGGRKGVELPPIMMMQSPYGPPEQVGFPEPGGVRAMLISEQHVFLATAAINDANPQNNGKAKLLRYEKSNPLGGPTVAFQMPPDLDGAPNTGYRLAYDGNSVALLDFSPLPNGAGPSAAYVARSAGGPVLDLMAVAFEIITPTVSAVAGSGGQFYWFQPGSMSHLSVSPKGMETIASPSPVFPPPEFDAMVSDGTNLFLGGPDGSVHTCPLPCATAAADLVGQTQAPGAIVSMVIDGSDLYFSTLGTVGRIYKVPTSTRGATGLMPARDIGGTDHVPNGVPLGVGTPYSIAVDERHLLYTDRNGLHYVPKTDLGAFPRTIVPGMVDPRSIAVDKNHVYYGTTGGPAGGMGAVYRVQKISQSM